MKISQLIRKCASPKLGAPQKRELGPDGEGGEAASGKELLTWFNFRVARDPLIIEVAQISTFGTRHRILMRQS
jgi:hypothetical protein